MCQPGVVLLMSMCHCVPAPHLQQLQILQVAAMQVMRLNTSARDAAIKALPATCNIPRLASLREMDHPLVSCLMKLHAQELKLVSAACYAALVRK